MIATEFVAAPTSHARVGGAILLEVAAAGAEVDCFGERGMKAGWLTKRFGDVLEIRTGKNQREVESPDGVYPIFGSAGNVMGYATSFICEAGTTIIGRKGNINTPIYSETNFWNVDTAFGLVVKQGLDRKFLYYFCIFFDFSALNRGTTIPSLVKSELLGIPIPVPPLPEQQRIVTILDEAFDGIAIAKANAEKNLRNARALFESQLDAVLSRRGPGYKETTLGAEVDLLPGYAFPSGGYTYATDAIRLLRGDNIMQGYFRWEDAKGWPSNDCSAYARFALQDGDVVIAMDRPWVKAGLKRAQIGTDDLPSLLVQRTSRLRTLGALSMNFLFHLTGSRSFSRHLLELQTGIGVPHISGKQIESFKFMLPPMADQESISDTLNELLANTQRLEQIYKEKLMALDELKKSLLQRAFKGDL